MSGPVWWVTREGPAEWLGLKKDLGLGLGTKKRVWKRPPQGCSQDQTVDWFWALWRGVCRQKGITIFVRYQERCQNPEGEVTKEEKQEKRCSNFRDVPGGGDDTWMSLIIAASTAFLESHDPTSSYKGVNIHILLWCQVSSDVARTCGVKRKLRTRPGFNPKHHLTLIGPHLTLLVPVLRPIHVSLQKNQNS